MLPHKLRPFRINPPVILPYASGSEFSPFSIPSLVLWFDPSQGRYQEFASQTTLATANNDPVGSIITRTGQVMASGSDSSRPTLLAAAKNGRDVIDFDGTDDFLSCTTTMAATAFTVFWVGQRTGAGDQAILSPGSSSRFWWRWQSGTARSRVDQRGVVALADSLNTHPTDVWTSINFSYTNNTTNPQFRYNGSDDSPAPVTARTFSAFDRFCLGKEFPNSANFLNGPIGDVLVFSENLPLATVQTIESWLNSRWGIY